MTKPKPNTRKPISSFFKSKLFLCSIMASILFLSLLSLSLFFSLSSAHHNHNTHRRPSPKPSFAEIAQPISQACKATRYPDTCQSSLTQSNKVPPNPTTLQIIQSSFCVTSQNLKRAQSMVNNILDASTGNQNRSNAANTCLEVLSNSEYRKSAANDAVPRGGLKDARAWMSAALAYQYDCWSSLKYANDTSLVNETMSFLDGLIGLSSNTLSMLRSYDIYGDDTKLWTAPQTERDGFWESSVNGGQLGFNGGVPSNLPVDATVCVGGCKYNSVQDAVNAAPDNDATRKFVVRIKEGIYNEIVRIPFEKKNVVFIGDGMGKTVITGSLNVGQLGMTTYHSATVGVLGDGFMATGITIQNTAGPDAHQAVAFRSDSDLSVIENCEFLGNQDTLYAHSLRQFYKSCRIQGNVDFVFGNSASIFQDCQILVAPRQLKPEKGENNAVTAVGRTDPSQTTGFVFINCLLNGTEAYMKLYNSKPSVHKNYLGRPWKEFSRTVFIQCNFEALITPAGWMPWSGDFALKTLYYGEYNNTGPGADVSQRVSWSNQIPAEHVNTYSVQNFIQGDKWIQKTS